MIKIGNKRLGDVGEYCGRPSPLGNPYRVGEWLRDRACDAYEAWFTIRVVRGDFVIMAELHRLQQIHRERGELTLLCFCYPHRCHCETIKRWLEANP